MLSDKGLKTKDPPSVHILADRGRAGSIEGEIGRISQQINKRYHRLAAPCIICRAVGHWCCGRSRRDL